MKEKIQSWSTENLSSNARANRHFPSEYLLRTFVSRDYLKKPILLNPGMKILDVGCLYMNNLVPFSDRGLQLHGIEVNSEMIALAEQNARNWGLQAEIKEGNNQNIPYPDSSFDVLLSVNAVHYEEGAENIAKALAEFSRVTKDSASILIVSNGKKNEMHKNAERLGENRYRLRTGEFRNNQVMGYFDDITHFEHVLGQTFKNIEIAEILEIYPKQTINFYVALCRKN